MPLQAVPDKCAAEELEAKAMEIGSMQLTKLKHDRAPQITKRKPRKALPGALDRL